MEDNNNNNNNIDNEEEETIADDNNDDYQLFQLTNGDLNLHLVDSNEFEGYWPMEYIYLWEVMDQYGIASEECSIFYDKIMFPNGYQGSWHLFANDHPNIFRVDLISDRKYGIVDDAFDAIENCLRALSTSFCSEQVTSSKYSHCWGYPSPARAELLKQMFFNLLFSRNNNFVALPNYQSFVSAIVVFTDACLRHWRAVCMAWTNEYVMTCDNVYNGMVVSTLSFEIIRNNKMQDLMTHFVTRVLMEKETFYRKLYTLRFWFSKPETTKLTEDITVQFRQRPIKNFLYMQKVRGMIRLFTVEEWDEFQIDVKKVINMPDVINKYKRGGSMLWTYTYRTNLEDVEENNYADLARVFPMLYDSRRTDVNVIDTSGDNLNNAFYYGSDDDRTIDLNLANIRRVAYDDDSIDSDVVGLMNAANMDDE